MKLTFNLDPNNIIECKWTLLTGLEIYKLNDTEFFRTRSFKPWGSSQFEVNVNGERKIIRIHLKFRPSFRSLFQSTGFVAQVYSDGELFIDNLLTSQYHHKNIFIKTLDNVALIFSILILILVVAATLFSTELFPLPESGRIRIAALATPECLAAYPEMDKSMISSEQVAIGLRKDEMNRKQSWVPSGSLSVFAIITNGYGRSPSACQQSSLELFDQYITNGANINTVRSNFKQFTILQDAIMLRDLPLICELLKRGASTDIKVIANDFDGTPSSISGLTTYELPSFLSKKMNDPIYQQILKMFDGFKTTERCQI